MSELGTVGFLIDYGEDPDDGDGDYFDEYRDDYGDDPDMFLAESTPEEHYECWRCMDSGEVPLDGIFLNGAPLMVPCPNCRGR